MQIRRTGRWIRDRRQGVMDPWVLVLPTGTTAYHALPIGHRPPGLPADDGKTWQTDWILFPSAIARQACLPADSGIAFSSPSAAAAGAAGKQEDGSVGAGGDHSSRRYFRTVRRSTPAARAVRARLPPSRR